MSTSPSVLLLLFLASPEWSIRPAPFRNHVQATLVLTSWPRAWCRSSEFVPNGIKVVCSSRQTPRLQKLQKLSLYDNMLSSVKVSARTHTFYTKFLLVAPCTRATIGQ